MYSYILYNICIEAVVSLSSCTMYVGVLVFSLGWIEGLELVSFE